MPDSPSAPLSSRAFGAGLVYTIAAYGLWGLLPLYFLVLEPSGAIEIVALRIVFSFIFCALLLAVVRGGWRRLVAVMRDGRAIRLLTVAGVLIAGNWTIYVVATVTGHIVEASFGYFINPIVTVLLGVVVLRERLRPLQWAAIGISVTAVLVLAIGYGSVPWISFGLAATFGLYGLVKKSVGDTVDAVSGLTVETAVLSPVAAGVVIWMAAVGSLTLGSHGAGHTTLLLLAGVVTAVPLLFFAAGARRLPLTTIGLMQYIAPIVQLLVGVVVNSEPMPLERWVGFGIVWVALAVFTIDMFRHTSRRRGTGRAVGAELV